MLETVYVIGKFEMSFSDSLDWECHQQEEKVTNILILPTSLRHQHLKTNITVAYVGLSGEILLSFECWYYVDQFE